MEVSNFTCTICGESSRDICVFCTKDTCSNHLCEKCRRCSDCCACEMRFVDSDTNGLATHVNGHQVHALEAHDHEQY